MDIYGDMCKYNADILAYLSYVTDRAEGMLKRAAESAIRSSTLLTIRNSYFGQRTAKL